MVLRSSRFFREHTSVIVDKTFSAPQPKTTLSGCVRKSKRGLIRARPRRFPAPRSATVRPLARSRLLPLFQPKSPIQLLFSNSRRTRQLKIRPQTTSAK